SPAAALAELRPDSWPAWPIRRTSNSLLRHRTVATVGYLACEAITPNTNRVLRRVKLSAATGPDCYQCPFNSNSFAAMPLREVTPILLMMRRKKVLTVLGLIFIRSAT